MTRTGERAALAATGILLVLLAIASALGERSGLLVYPALLPLHLLTLIVSAMVYLRLRLARLAHEEEQDRKARPGSSSRLFDADADAGDPLSVSRTHRQIERFVVPFLAPALAILAGTWAWSLYQRLPWGGAPAGLALPSLALFAGQAFVLFLLHRYLLGLSAEPSRAALRGPGGLAGLLTYGSLLAAAASLAHHAGFTWLDTWAAMVLVAVTGLLAVELAWNALVSLYSPRRDHLRSVSYESRLALWLAAPAGWTRSVSDSVDYQFGFSLSGTWFVRFLKRALLPFAAFQVFVVYALSSVAVIGPGEIGLREHFGKPVEPDPRLGPGLHLTLPWPFETVRRVPVRQVQHMELGIGGGDEDLVRPEMVLWTVPHYRSETLFVTASRTRTGGGAVPVSLLSAHLPVEYTITNALHYAYGYTEPAAALRHAAYRELTRALASRDLGEWLGEERLAIADGLKAALQASADRLGLGIRIDFVGLQGIHPPVQVAEAYQSVVGAVEEKEALLLDARAYTNRVLPRAAADAEARRTAAAAERDRRTVTAAAESDLFRNRSATAILAPGLYRTRTLMETVRDSLAEARPVIVAAPRTASDVLWLNLEDDPFTSVFDLVPLETEGLMP